MKKIFFVALAATIVACNANKSGTTESPATSTDTTSQKINSPYPVAYSSDFAIDEPKNAETILTIWKDWDNGDLSAHKDLFADSIYMHFANGMEMNGPRDSMLAMAQKARDASAKVVSSVDAIIPVKSKDKNERWALIWGKEVDTDKSGKVDSVNIQETWRFNKDGQADLLYQYHAATNPPHH
ncbi:MAG TPA: hypothetical protein VFT78_16500 [Hanamia sp.]|nr:hypothetical protein [Hanamia sp.]